MDINKLNSIDLSGATLVSVDEIVNLTFDVQGYVISVSAKSETDFIINSVIYAGATYTDPNFLAGFNSWASLVVNKIWPEIKAKNIPQHAPIPTFEDGNEEKKLPFYLKKNEKSGKNRLKPTIIIAPIVIIVAALALIFGGDNEQAPPTEPVTAGVSPTVPLADSTDAAQDNDDSDQTVFGLGDTFRFNGSSGYIELTFEPNFTFAFIDNQFSENNGEEVIVIPVTMTNVGDETGRLNMFDVTIFGSNGSSLNSVDAHFTANSILWGNDLRTGASVSSYFHVLYDGSGEYVVEFASGFGFGDRVELIFEVSR